MARKSTGQPDTYDGDDAGTQVWHVRVEDGNHPRPDWEQVGPVLGHGTDELGQHDTSALAHVDQPMEHLRTLMSRFRDGLELRNAKSTASWSMADLLETSGRAAKTALRRARGPEARLVDGSSAVAAIEALARRWVKQSYVSAGL
jgi:hypothetical protein